MRVCRARLAPNFNGASIVRKVCFVSLQVPPRFASLFREAKTTTLALRPPLLNYLLTCLSLEKDGRALSIDHMSSP